MVGRGEARCCITTTLALMAARHCQIGQGRRCGLASDLMQRALLPCSRAPRSLSLLRQALQSSLRPALLSRRASSSALMKSGPTSAGALTKR